MKIHSQHDPQMRYRADGRKIVIADSQSARGFGADPIKVSTMFNAPESSVIDMCVARVTVAGGNFRETSRGERSKIFAKFSETSRRRWFDHRLSLSQSGRWQIDVSVIHLIYLAADILVLGF